jgi:hypothetical protein
MKRFELLILRLSTPLTRWSFHHLASFFAHFGLTKYVKAACGEVPFLTLNEKKTKGGETPPPKCMPSSIKKMLPLPFIPNLIREVS